MTQLFLILCMFVSAVIAAVVGQGGGVMYTPLQLWFGTEVHQAAATSLFLIMVLSFSSSLVFAKAGRVDWPLVIVLESVTTSGAFVGGLVSEWFPNTALTIALGFTITAAAVPMITNMKRKTPSVGKGGLLSWRRNTFGREYSVNLAIAVPVAAVAGLLSGLTGIGGGVLKVSMMVLLLGVPIEVAVGSSSFMVGITAAGGFAGHIIRGHWDWKSSLPLAVAVFAGAQIGSRISIGLDKEKLEKIFGWVLLAVAALTFAMVI
jgi:uncharacterized membrane protein YfcA